MVSIEELNNQVAKLTERVAKTKADYIANLEEFKRLCRLKRWIRQDENSIRHIEAEIAKRVG